MFCLGDSCFNTAYANDADFARSMTYMEAAREAGQSEAEKQGLTQEQIKNRAEEQTQNR